MQKHSLTLTLEGTQKEDGHIRVSDFTKALKALIGIVNTSETIANKIKQPSMYFRIIGLSHGSPATVTMEAIPKDIDFDERVIVLNNMLENMSRIKDEENISTFDYRLLNALSELTSPIGQTINNLKLAWSDQVIELNAEYKEKIYAVMSKEETYPGSIRGMLEFINLHASNKLFRIYPDFGPILLNCRFPEELTELAISAIQKFVEVRGFLKQKLVAQFPYEIDIEAIEILPPEDELPSLFEMRGIAPGATGDMSSEDFIRSIRNEQ